MRYLYGAPVMTLSEVVTELNIEQGNLGQNHFASSMVSAKWVWKDILWNIAWSVAQKQIEVIDNKITLPIDVVRLINISVMDKCGNLQPLGFNPNINTLELQCAKTSCSCSACNGVGTLCSGIDNITIIEEEVIIEGLPYTKTTTTRADQGGIYKIINTPTLQYGDPNEVVYIELRELVCTLETDNNGCIKYTEPNRHKLMEHCGCWLPAADVDAIYPYYGHRRFMTYPYSDRPGDTRDKKCERTVPVTSNNYGYYNWDAVAGDVIHLKDVTASSVIVSYQTSGEGVGAEMLVPQTAVDAIKFGIMYRQKAFSPIYGYNEKNACRVDYERAKDALWKFRNPIRMDEFIKTQTIMPKW